MSVTPILRPFDNEHVVGVSPAPAARVDDWNRRLRLFTGRALSSDALASAQAGTSGRLALRGQAKSSGVVVGLETALETAQDGSVLLNIAAGFGTVATGEDVWVPSPIRVNVRSIEAFAPAALLDGGPAPGPGPLVPRRLGPTLDTLIAKNVAVAHTGMLLLQPIVTDTLGAFDPTDQCLGDPSSDAFADEQLLDGCRLIYYAWPTEWMQLPAGDRARNNMAYEIFRREARLGPNEFFPWEQIGLPIGLLSLDDAGKPLFVDRAAVVRLGGKPKRRTSFIPAAGNPFLWQARLEQFAGHLTGLDLSNTKPDDLAKEFRYLPPAGLLPMSALDFQLAAASVGKNSRVAGSRFFPGNFRVNAIPAPAEQLDMMLNACASLAPLDTFISEDVTVVVPVPQIWYEPDLLQVVRIDALFQETVDDFVHRRAIWLKRRADVRIEDLALVKAVNGTARAFPDPDPDAVEPNEDIAATEIDPAIPEFTTAELPYGTAPGSTPATPLVNEVASVVKQLTGVRGPGDELPALTTQNMGLEQFAALLKQKSDAANDHIDLSFLRVQTDIYRTRQKMLSSEAATRLAVSPALAAIAEGQSALATKADLDEFLANVKSSATTTVAAAAHPLVAEVAVAPPKLNPVLKSEAFVVNPGLAALKLALPRPTAPKVPVPSAPVATATVLATKAATLSQASLFTATAATSSHDISQERPIVGATYELRTTSVVERLTEPPSTEVKNYTVASKFNAINGFKNSGLFIDDISIPGFRDANGNEINMAFKDIGPAQLSEILAGTHDTIPASPTESDIFAAGVRAMENTIQISRLIEGRVQAYRNAIDIVNQSIANLNGLIGQAGQRLRSIADNLGKARHDVSVAKALMAEEQTRIDGLNAGRDQIVSKYVSFLAYFRPRTADALTALPVRQIDPGITESPIPAALTRTVTEPPELQAMVNTLRDAPLSWFTYLPPVLNVIDRFDTLQQMVQYSKARAGFRLFEAPDPPPTSRPGPLSPNILSLIAGQRQVVTQQRLATAAFDVSSLTSQTWQQSRDLALLYISPGDLIDAGHIHPAVPKVPAAELANILKIASCLYADLGAVLPAIRLDWAERLIAIDGTVNLANLSSLPRWGEVPILDRQEMQSFVDWLYGRINRAVPQAVAHMNDLIRVCILLASHAPVAEVIAGSVIQPVSVVPGARIPIAVDIGKVRVGMQVLMYQANQTAAQGVVEDLASGVATARVLSVASQGVALSANSKVHFAEAADFARNPTTQNRLLL